jgi:AraC-like DNA-binding protein
MGPFDEVIGGMHVGSSLYGQYVLHEPWAVRFPASKYARLLVVTRGSCWLHWQGSRKPLRVEAGDCVITKPGLTCSLSDSQQRLTAARQELTEGSRAQAGTGPATALLVGRFAFDPVAAEPLLALLPALLHLPLKAAHSELLQTTLSLIAKETSGAGLGAGIIVDRLTDVLFVQAMRALFSEGCDFVPSWVTALSDRRVARAIRALHADLARPWSVAELAREAGISRSSFAAAFKATVGEAPLDYVTSWRIYHAKLLLASSDASLSEIAGRVGYESDTALIRAFKRKVGTPPGQYRSKVLRGTPG